MNDRDFHRFTEHLKMAVTRDRGVLGLIALNLAAASDPGDEFSDHDFWIVASAGSQAAYLTERSWLPDPEEVLIETSPSPGHRTFVLRSGHQVKIRVLDVDELGAEDLGPHEVLLDRGGLKRLLSAIADQRMAKGDPPTGSLEALCVLLNTSRREWQRGNRLSSEWFSGRAIDEAVALFGSTGEPAAGRAGLEHADPDLAKTLADLSRLSPQDLGGPLLGLVNARLRAIRPELAWDTANAFAATLDDAQTQLDEAALATPPEPDSAPQPGHDSGLAPEPESTASVLELAPTALENTTGENGSGPCPKCESQQWTWGRLFKKGSFEEIRFLANDSSRWSLKQEVFLHVCDACGYSEIEVLPK